MQRTATINDLSTPVAINNNIPDATDRNNIWFVNTGSKRINFESPKCFRSSKLALIDKFGSEVFWEGWNLSHNDWFKYFCICASVPDDIRKSTNFVPLDLMTLSGMTQNFVPIDLRPKSFHNGVFWHANFTTTRNHRETNNPKEF